MKTRTKAKCPRKESRHEVKRSHVKKPPPLIPLPIPNHPRLTQARIDQILHLTATGTALYRACEQCGIADTTWYRACDDAPWLHAATTRARECSGDREAAEVREAALGEGRYADLPVDERRLIVDSLKWTSARKAPKRWGDKLEITGPAGLPSPEQARVLIVQLELEERQLLAGGK